MRNHKTTDDPNYTWDGERYAALFNSYAFQRLGDKAIEEVLEGRPISTTVTDKLGPWHLDGHLHNVSCNFWHGGGPGTTHKPCTARVPNDDERDIIAIEADIDATFIGSVTGLDDNTTTPHAPRWHTTMPVSLYVTAILSLDPDTEQIISVTATIYADDPYRWDLCGTGIHDATNWGVHTIYDGHDSNDPPSCLAA